MGLNRSKGNMYDWVTHIWSPIIGCPHQCSYCYVKAFRDQPVKPELQDDFPKLGTGRVIFVGHLCDMFAQNVPSHWITKVMEQCTRYRGNQYVFQTKNPHRFYEFLPFIGVFDICGTTIETNRWDLIQRISRAPHPVERAEKISCLHVNKFVTIEPILDFDVGPMVDLLCFAQPSWINIGADSKGHGLPEPAREKVLELVAALQEKGITIRKKMNLDRLISSPPHGINEKGRKGEVK